MSCQIQLTQVSGVAFHHQFLHLESKVHFVSTFDSMPPEWNQFPEKEKEKERKSIITTNHIS